MISIMEKHTIITLKNEGYSNREVAKLTGVHRKTVGKYWNTYLKQNTELDQAIAQGSSEDVRKIQEAIIEKPKYDSSRRGYSKYTPAIDEALDDILAAELIKINELGKTNKQMLYGKDIHQMLVDQGFDIGVSTIRRKIREKRQKACEAFIRQEYDLADRLEFDFGEVRLIIDGVQKTYYLAVLASPASKFRWAYLYTNQKKDVFLDAHVRFFTMAGGIWREVVYDNMKNVVTKFIGRNEKELSEDLIKMSMYYGFSPNTTNCFAGNEKGFVEGSVKVLRREAFSKNYHFDSLDEAKAHLEDVLTKANTTSRIEEELQVLLPAKAPLEIARISEVTVDKYSFVRVENNFYSVPDYLVARKLTVKSYAEEVVIYSGTEKVCVHKKAEGVGTMTVDIFHYLKTLAKKPGALSNSLALKSKAELKAVFDRHYRDRPKHFIELLKQNEGKPIDEIVGIARLSAKDTTVFSNTPVSLIAENILTNTRQGLSALSTTFLKDGERLAS